MERDPRVEPRAGDVVENGDYTGRVCVVHESFGVRCVMIEELTRGIAWGAVMTIEEWRQKFFTATVIHVSEDSDNG